MPCAIGSTQFASQTFTRMKRAPVSSGSDSSAGRSSSSGTGAVSPIQTKTMPKRSSAGYVRARSLPMNGESGRSMSPATHWPVPSNT